MELTFLVTAAVAITVGSILIVTGLRSKAVVERPVRVPVDVRRYLTRALAGMAVAVLVLAATGCVDRAVA
jgi:hypothetical protein